MIGDSGHHASGRALHAAVARLAGPPAVIVIASEHCESRLQVPQLLGKAVRQPVEPLEEQPLSAVQPLDVRRAYSALLAVAYSTPLYRKPSGVTGPSPAGSLLSATVTPVRATAFFGEGCS